MYKLGSGATEQERYQQCVIVFLSNLSREKCNMEI